MVEGLEIYISSSNTFSELQRDKEKTVIKFNRHTLITSWDDGFTSLNSEQFSNYNSDMKFNKFNIKQVQSSKFKCCKCAE